MPRTGTHIQRAFLCALASLAMAAGTAAASSTGGQPGPAEMNVPTDGSVVISAKRSARVGSPMAVRGASSRARRRTVRIDARLGRGAWQTVASTVADREGAFRTTWTPSAAGRYAIRAVVTDTTSGARSSGSVGSEPRTLTAYAPVKATWYGPGFYGNRTACGQEMSKTLQGVAHKTLPCGTKVALSYKGRRTVVPVVDRGPYAHGAHYDLTVATAQKLGFTTTDVVNAAPLR